MKKYKHFWFIAILVILFILAEYLSAIHFILPIIAYIAIGLLLIINIKRLNEYELKKLDNIDKPIRKVVNILLACITAFVVWFGAYNGPDISKAYKDLSYTNIFNFQIFLKPEVIISTPLRQLELDITSIIDTIKYINGDIEEFSSRYIFDEDLDNFYNKTINIDENGNIIGLHTLPTQTFEEYDNTVGRNDRKLTNIKYLPLIQAVLSVQDSITEFDDSAVLDNTKNILGSAYNIIRIRSKFKFTYQYLYLTLIMCIGVIWKTCHAIKIIVSNRKNRRKRLLS